MPISEEKIQFKINDFKAVSSSFERNEHWFILKMWFILKIHLKMAFTNQLSSDAKFHYVGFNIHMQNFIMLDSISYNF